MAIKLIILGLRRSGTTIFWEIFRQDPRLVCYDEPFNELLLTLPDGRQIYAKMGLSDPGPDFSRVPAPNRPYDEASPDWQRYLRAVGLKIGAAGEPCSDAGATTS